MTQWSDNEFMPLNLVPEGVLEDGGHRVEDAEGAYLCCITGDQERAERFIATANVHDALTKALKHLRNEAAGVLGLPGIGGPTVRDVIGNTNYRCVERAIEEADAALALTQGDNNSERK